MTAADNETGRKGGESVAKPWSKIEIDYINHDKFKAINANAICLWHEGKNYCDVRLTDGLIPEATAKLFRFYSKKAVEMLTRSCGLKPGTSEPYAALWEVVDGFGFKMHDYLAHNDSRDVVEARFAEAAAQRERRKQWQKDYRDQRKAERRQRSDNVESTLSQRSSPVDPLQLQQQIQHQHHAPSERKKSGGDMRSGRPIFSGQRIVVFEWQLDELVKMLGAHAEAFDLHEWFFQADAKALTLPMRKPREWWPWLQQETLLEAARRGLPVAVAGAEDAEFAAIIAKGPSVRP